MSPSPAPGELAAAIERCRAGDVAGLAVLYRAFGERVYRVCRSILGQAADAEDAAQEVFLRVFDKIKTFDGRSALGTWIYRVAVNHCLNLKQSWRRLPRLLLGEAEGSALALGLVDGSRNQRAVDDRDAADALLSLLPTDQRAVLALREIEGLDYRSIAEVLDVPIGTVMSRLARARAALSRVLAPAPAVACPLPSGGRTP